MTLQSQSQARRLNRWKFGLGLVFLCSVLVWSGGAHAQGVGEAWASIFWFIIGAAGIASVILGLFGGVIFGKVYRSRVLLEQRPKGKPLPSILFGLVMGSGFLILPPVVTVFVFFFIPGFNVEILLILIANLLGLALWTTIGMAVIDLRFSITSFSKKVRHLASSVVGSRKSS